VTTQEIGGIEHARDACSFDGCGKDGRLVGFGCPGFRPIYACQLHDPQRDRRPTGFRHHRLLRGVSLTPMARALGWSPSRVSAVEMGRERLDQLELAYWWRCLDQAASTPEAREWAGRRRTAEGGAV